MGWKLVRDRNQEHCQGRISGEWRVSPDPEGALMKKLGEELGEFTENRDPGELYDLLDVIMELRTILDPLREHRDIHLRKRRLMGGFSRHMEWHPNPQLDLWQKEEA